jgi:hypothetical protein
MGQFSALHIDVQSEDCVGAYVLLPRGGNRLRPSGAAMVRPSTVSESSGTRHWLAATPR